MIWAVLAAAGLSAVQAADWPQFRGMKRDGISPETGLLTDWPEGGPAELWRRPIGPAFSGLAVVDSELFTTESDDKLEFALAIDVASGETRWRTPLGPTFKYSYGNGARSTPTVDRGMVYALSGHGLLAALDRENGKVRWWSDLKERFASPQMVFGFATAPLVVGDHLLIEAGGTQNTSIVALEKTSGEILWHTENSPAAYSSPILVHYACRDQLIFVNADNVLSITPDGNVLWSHPWASGHDIKPALPLFVPPDLLFVSASYDIGALVLRLRTEDGGIAVEELWQSRVMRNHFNSSVLIDGYIYGFDNTALKCIDPRTGEQQWAWRRGLGKGSLIYADDHLLVLTEKGRLVAVEATPEAYREKASVQVLHSRSWSPPSLAHGRLFLRNCEELVCLDLRAERSDTPDAK